MNLLFKKIYSIERIIKCLKNIEVINFTSEGIIIISDQNDQSEELPNGMK